LQLISTFVFSRLDYCNGILSGLPLSVPRTRTKFGDRAFSVAGPVVWNNLPAAVRHADSLHSFKRRLKSHFFSLCFNDWPSGPVSRVGALNSLLLTYFFFYLWWSTFKWKITSYVISGLQNNLSFSRCL